MQSQDETNFKKECEKFTNLYEDGRILKENFIRIPMWFDNDETSATLNSILLFNFSV